MIDSFLRQGLGGNMISGQTGWIQTSLLITGRLISVNLRLFVYEMGILVSVSQGYCEEKMRRRI